MRSFLDDFGAEEVILHKPDGSVFTVYAVVSAGEFHSDDPSIPIEDGDFFERHRGSIVEYYKVIDAGFYKDDTGIVGDHYQTVVEKLSGPLTFSKGDSPQESNMDKADHQQMRKTVFISHRSKDKAVADMLLDYLVGCGVPKNKVFCSSLPGNDVDSIIPVEVKQRLRESAVNILILSRDYYQSAFCLNEAGVIWYLEEEVAVVPVGLPEIKPEDMVGFVDRTRILRRLDCDTDIAHIYDIVQERLDPPGVRHTVITAETQKLKERYRAHIAGRENNDYPEKAFPQEKAVLITPDAGLLLMYAAVDPHGQIVHPPILGGESIATAGFEFIQAYSAKEISRWKGAVLELEGRGYIRAAGHKRQIFEVTREGFDVAEKLAQQNPHIDTARDPKMYLQ